MRQDQKPGCTPFNKKGINTFYLLVQIYKYLISKTREISIKLTFKNNTFTRQRILIVPEHATLKRLHQIVTIMNVPPNTKKSSSSFNSSFNIFMPIICYVKALQGCLGVREKLPPDKTESIYCSSGLLRNFYRHATLMKSYLLMKMIVLKIKMKI